MTDQNLNEYLDDVAELEDQTETQTSSGYTPPEAGPCFVRMVEYVELGNHVKKYNGKPKPSAPQVRIGFELLSKRHIKETSDGKKYSDIIRITLPKSTHQKANFKKLFNQLRGSDESITHMAQMLGRKAWMAEVIHDKWTNQTGQEVTSAKLQGPQGYTFRPAVSVDADTGETKAINVPPAMRDLVVFIWNKPRKDMWDKLFIDGTDDNDKSKNKVQELIMAADNYAGSPLMHLLNGAADLPTDGVVDEPKVEKKAAKKAAKKATKAEVAEAPTVPDIAPVGDVVSEMLAETGLAESDDEIPY